MYKDHKCFTPPHDPETKLWRYMSFAKFVSLIDRKALFLSRLDQLAQNDPFEGSVPRMERELMNHMCIIQMSVCTMRVHLMNENIKSCGKRQNSLKFSVYT